MTGTGNCYRVSDTAALVMLWAAGYYEGKPLTGSYLRQLDLSAGRPLIDRYDAICPWYSEVIINRKHFIMSSVEALVRTMTGPVVIVNLGAGFSPLALELAPLFDEHVRFVEIDLCNMDKKAGIYRDLIPDKARFITCTEADIGDTNSLSETLSPLVNNNMVRLIVVMEGLTYYIGRPVMEQVLSYLSGLTREQYIVFEHLKPCRLISEERRFIPYRIFSDVRDYTSMQRMITYSRDEIIAMLGPGFSCRYSDMDVMEKRRTGANKYFPTPDSGWLSCAIAGRTGPREIPGD